MNDERVRKLMMIIAIACAIVGVALIVYGQFAGDEADVSTRDLRDEAILGGVLYLIGGGGGTLLARRNGIRLMLLILRSTIPALIFMLFGTQLLMPWGIPRGEVVVVGIIAAVSGAVTLAVWLWIVVAIIRAITGSKADAPPPLPRR